MTGANGVRLSGSTVPFAQVSVHRSPIFVQFECEHGGARTCSGPVEHLLDHAHFVLYLSMNDLPSLPIVLPLVSLQVGFGRQWSGRTSRTAEGARSTRRSRPRARDCQRAGGERLWRHRLRGGSAESRASLCRHGAAMAPLSGGAPGRGRCESGVLHDWPK